MPQSQTFEYDAETIALAQARQEESEQEAEAEETEAAATAAYIETAQKSSVGIVELFLIMILAFVFWLLSLIPYLGILFSVLGVSSIALWYKARHLHPLSFGTAGQISKIAGGRAEEFVKKIPGGSDFLFFLGVFLIDATPFINFFPALPGLVFTIYLANRK